MTEPSVWDRLLCWVFGHVSLATTPWRHSNEKRSNGWRCQRCGVFVRENDQ